MITPPMVISEDGVAFIKKEEGFSPTLYQDTTKRAIGYGVNLTPEEAAQWEGKTITEEQADLLMRVRLDVIQEAINKLINVPINQPQYDAICSFCYNEGAGALKGHTLLAYLNARSYEGAARQFLRWNKKHTPTGEIVEDAGLTKRRRKEMVLFSAGDYSAE